MTDKPTRVLLGIRGMTSESSQRIANSLLALPGVSEATPDEEQIEVHYDPSQNTVMDLIRTVRAQGFLAGML